ELVAAALPPELADLRADLDDVRAAARSGATMVRKLLGFSRRADLRLQPTNLADLVTDLSGLMRRVFPASIEIQLAVDPDLPDVVADPGAVQQILLNLLTNARDAMPNGGTVRIETAVRPDANVVCLAVRDSGEGMDARTKAKLFEPFFTTKPPGKGTGLGLSMVHGLVLQHGGSIDVESEPGCGTTVRICFPTCRERAAAAIPAPVDAVAGGTETILVVEDEEVLRRSAKRALERLGYTVLLAADGVEALDLFRANAQRIELVVADGVMPRMGGRDLYAALRREGSTVKFLLASGYALRESGAAASGVDPIPFLPKPWTLAELGRKVREVLDERARFEAPALTDL
ncbi:MAG TPA: ATP-binding protein, partial [Gemmatimonadales bacterium]|nr:ATP-binding protein [Gemmatimonadales bacterium]